MWLSLNEEDGRPIYLQIVAQITRQVAEGTLGPGYELPSVRELAGSLGVNMHTVRAAYLRLRDRGIISLHLGRRARIRADAGSAVSESWRAQLAEAASNALTAGATPAELHRALEISINQNREALR